MPEEVLRAIVCRFFKDFSATDIKEAYFLLWCLHETPVYHGILCSKVSNKVETEVLCNAVGL